MPHIINLNLFWFYSTLLYVMLTSFKYFLTCCHDNRFQILIINVFQSKQIVWKYYKLLKSQNLQNVRINQLNTWVKLEIIIFLPDYIPTGDFDLHNTTYKYWKVAKLAYNIYAEITKRSLKPLMHSSKYFPVINWCMPLMILQWIFVLRWLVGPSHLKKFSFRRWGSSLLQRASYQVSEP